MHIFHKRQGQMYNELLYFYKKSYYYGKLYSFYHA